jgi:predicted PurR-regulated permease PerM
MGSEEHPEPRGATAPAPGARPVAVPPVVVPRWVQLVILPLALLAGWAVLNAAGPIVLIFTIAALVALLLNPIVTLLRRAHLPRGLAVLVTYLGLALVLTGVGMLLSNPLANQVSAFQDSVPNLVSDANRSLDDLQGWLDRNGVDLQVKEPGRSALESLGTRVAQGSGELVNLTRDALLRLVEASIAVILVVVLSVYMLLYGERIGEIVRGVVPRGDGTPADDYPARVQSAVFGYVRGQILFSLIMGSSAGVLLWVLGSLGIFPEGKTYALFFGAFYGFAELIPYVGPAIGAAPPVLIALFGDSPLDAVWLVVAFTALQQLEGHVVAPQVFSQALRINPLLVIFALLLGGQVYGIIGAFIALPIAAILRETIVYLRRHLVLEPWGTPSAQELGKGPPGASANPGGEPPPDRRCPECGTPRTPGAAYCSACGTELGAADDAAAAASAGPA